MIDKLNPDGTIEKISDEIADRSNVFYWQTDRAINPEMAGKVWADRHRYFSDTELIERVNQVLLDDELVEIESLNLDAQTNLGNVNSVRVGKLASGKEVIIRCHPKGVKNGYFHAEATAAQKAKDTGIPTYSTLAIHDFRGEDDFSFHILEKLPGTAIKVWLESHPDDEELILRKAGEMMAKIHQVKVEGFGPFDNEKAKEDKLIGKHDSLVKSVRAGLEFNLKVLVEQSILSEEQAAKINQLFSDENSLLQTSESVLVHNDFADWNLLTDGKNVTGVLDWDECVGGDAVNDIACWSTFFPPERLEKFLEGYWSVVEKPDNFQDKFELLRLRYIISKMTLRTRRYTWDPSEFMKEKIETGKIHLQESLEYFDKQS